jgi:hypothetical protein
VIRGDEAIAWRRDIAAEAPIQTQHRATQSAQLRGFFGMHPALFQPITVRQAGMMPGQDLIQ